MEIGKMINIFDEYGVQVIAQVKLSNNLSGENRPLRGITRMRNGGFVYMYEDEWDGKINTEFITPQEALEKILHYQREDLLNEEKFADLQELMNTEWEDEYDEEKKEMEMEIKDIDSWVNVYDIQDKAHVIGRVRPTDNLTLENENLSMGITRLKNGKFVLVREVEDGKYIGTPIDAFDAMQLILQRGKDHLFDLPKFDDLRFLRDQTIELEWE